MSAGSYRRCGGEIYRHEHKSDRGEVSFTASATLTRMVTSIDFVWLPFSLRVIPTIASFLIVISGPLGESFIILPIKLHAPFRVRSLEYSRDSLTVEPDASQTINISFYPSPLITPIPEDIRVTRFNSGFTAARPGGISEIQGSDYEFTSSRQINRCNTGYTITLDIPALSLWQVPKQPIVGLEISLRPVVNEQEGSRHRLYTTSLCS